MKKGAMKGCVSPTRVTLSDRALVLEGGGIRGIFTAGVLDCFLDSGLDFGYTIGVSAGSTNGVNFIARQRGRTHYADTTLLRERRYIGLGVFLRKGVMIDMDMLFGEFSTTIYPFDWGSFCANANRFEIVTTDCATGAARYYERDESWDWDRLMSVARASSSLPFINRSVIVDGREMMDGGLSDSVPLARALDRGYAKAVVILTQCRGYRKAARRFKLPRFLLRRFPRIIDLLNSRAERYNRDMDWLDSLEDREDDNIIVLRPQMPLEVGRLTTDVGKVQRLYDEGYATARAALARLLKGQEGQEGQEEDNK